MARWSAVSLLEAASSQVPRLDFGISGLVFGDSVLFPGIPGLFSGIPDLFSGIPGLFSGIQCFSQRIPGLFLRILGLVLGTPGLFSGVPGISHVARWSAVSLLEVTSAPVRGWRVAARNTGGGFSV